MACDASKSQDNTRMLDRIIRVIKLRSHSRHVFLLAVLEHFFHPVRCQDLHIVVQETNGEIDFLDALRCQKGARE